MANNTQTITLVSNDDVTLEPTQVNGNLYNSFSRAGYHMNNYNIDRQWSLGLNMLTSGFNLANTVAYGRANVKANNAQLDQQASLIETNMYNQQALTMDNFNKGIAELQTYEAARNVSLNSQGVKADIIASGIQMGEDFSLQRTQTKLQQEAIRVQQKMNKRNQRQQELQAGINFAASVAMFL